jgi:hypothetical protein
MLLYVLCCVVLCAKHIIVSNPTDIILGWFGLRLSAKSVRTLIFATSSRSSYISGPNLRGKRNWQPLNWYCTCSFWYPHDSLGSLFTGVHQTHFLALILIFSNLSATRTLPHHKHRSIVESSLNASKTTDLCNATCPYVWLKIEFDLTDYDNEEELARGKQFSMWWHPAEKLLHQTWSEIRFSSF